MSPKYLKNRQRSIWCCIILLKMEFVSIKTKNVSKCRRNPQSPNFAIKSYGNNMIFSICFQSIMLTTSFLQKGGLDLFFAK